MPIMFGFARQRKKMLEAELERFLQEMPQLGMLRMWLTGDLARGLVRPESDLELLVVQGTEEPWRRREDFWLNHLRPRVSVRFNVFTPEEFESLEADDPVIRNALANGEPVHG